MSKTDPDLEGLSKQFYISKQYLANRFKVIYDITVLDYIHSKRLLKAKELVKDSTLHIMYIATMVGYDSSSHFNKQFKREFGVTPTEYREGSDSTI